MPHSLHSKDSADAAGTTEHLDTPLSASDEVLGNGIDDDGDDDGDGIVDAIRRPFADGWFAGATLQWNLAGGAIAASDTIPLVSGAGMTTKAENPLVESVMWADYDDGTTEVYFSANGSGPMYGRLEW